MPEGATNDTVRFSAGVCDKWFSRTSTRTHASCPSHSVLCGRDQGERSGRVVTSSNAVIGCIQAYRTTLVVILCIVTTLILVVTTLILILSRTVTIFPPYP